MKLAKTEITKHATKKSIITTFTAVAMAGTVATLSVCDAFGYEISDENAMETVTATVVTEKNVFLTVPTQLSSTPIVGATESLDEIIEGYQVVVDGEVKGVVSERGKVKIEEHFSQLLEEFTTDGEAKIYQNVSFEKGLFDAVSVVTSNTILSQNEFDVIEIKKVTDKKTIPFETVYEDTNKLGIGKTMVSVEGVDGVKATVTEIRYVNGKEVSREVVSEKTKKPVNKVVLNGTRRIPQLSSAQIEATGGFAFPLGDANYYVSSDFGYRTFDNSFHDGIDYAADYGTPVYAAMSGKVVFAGWDNTGYGNYVVIEHANGYKTGYAHLAEIVVSVGDDVPAGKCVGAVGSTGYSTGNHLHFSVRINGDFTNPTQFY